MGQLDGKVALVTGSGTGIGKGIARGLAREGASVVLAARRREPMENTSQELAELGVETLVVPTDVTVESQVESLFAKIMERFGRLDILVNNAGVVEGGPLEEMTVEQWDKVMAVNLRGPFLCTRGALRIMKKQRSGRIINTGSLAASRVRPDTAPYSASKHGIWGLTQVTALEGRPFGISCSCLHPGNVMVERRMGGDREMDQEPMMSVDEIAQAAVLMATLPPHVNMLEATVLPVQQQYVGRG